MLLQIIHFPFCMSLCAVHSVGILPPQDLLLCYRFSITSILLHSSMTTTDHSDHSLKTHQIIHSLCPLTMLSYKSKSKLFASGQSWATLQPWAQCLLPLSQRFRQANFCSSSQQSNVILTLPFRRYKTTIFSVGNSPYHNSSFEYNLKPLLYLPQSLIFRRFRDIDESLSFYRALAQMPEAGVKSWITWPWLNFLLPLSQSSEIYPWLVLMLAVPSLRRCVTNDILLIQEGIDNLLLQLTVQLS